MFDKEISFTGRHASYLRELAPNKSYSEKVEQRKTIFDSAIHAVLTAAAIGFIKGRKGAVHTDNNVATLNIFYDAVAKNKENLEMIYRLIMLLDAKDHLDVNTRIDKAFRYDEDVEKRKSGDEAFWAYVRGGIEYLYSNLIADSTDVQTDIQNELLFVNAFYEEFYTEKLSEDIISLCK